MVRRTTLIAGFLTAALVLSAVLVSTAGAISSTQQYSFAIGPTASGVPASSALIGTGTAKLNFNLGDGTVESLALKLYNAPEGPALLMTGQTPLIIRELSVGTLTEIPGDPKFGSKLSFALPPNFLSPAPGVIAALEDFQLTVPALTAQSLGGPVPLFAMTGCSQGSWYSKFAGGYSTAYSGAVSSSQQVERSQPCSAGNIGLSSLFLRPYFTDVSAGVATPFGTKDADFYLPKELASNFPMFPMCETTDIFVDETVCASSPSKPTTFAIPAVAIGDSSATLAGVINANGLTLTACYFRYGVLESDSWKVQSCGGALPTGTVATAVSGAVAGLTPGLDYEYQLVAQFGVANQEVRSLRRTFTTTGTAPPGTPPATIKTSQIAPGQSGRPVFADIFAVNDPALPLASVPSTLSVGLGAGLALGEDAASAPACDYASVLAGGTTCPDGSKVGRGQIDLVGTGLDERVMLKIYRSPVPGEALVLYDAASPLILHGVLTATAANRKFVMPFDSALQGPAPGVAPRIAGFALRFGDGKSTWLTSTAGGCPAGGEWRAEWTITGQDASTGSGTVASPCSGTSLAPAPVVPSALAVSPPPPSIARAAVPSIKGAAATVTGGQVTIPLACPPGVTCSGVATVVVPTAATANSGVARVKQVTIASGAYKVAGGRTASIKLKLTTAGRKLLKRRKRVKASVLLVARGSTTTVRKPVTLRIGTRQ